MANTRLKLNQLQQDGATSGQAVTWNGSTWVPNSVGSGTVTSVAATQPSAGLTITGTPITGDGTLVFALANDLAGVEGLTGTGLAVRTGDGTWNTRTLTYSGGEGMPFNVNVSNGSGVGGNPTIQIVNTPNTFKGAVKAATTAAITLSGAQTIDGVSVVSGDRVLVKNQGSAISNGIYKVQSGGWIRATDAGTDLGVANGTLVYVANGTVNAATYWKQDTANPVIGTDNIVYSQVFASSADGNGIYSGSGTIATAAVATVGSGSTFTIDYNGAANAILVSDSTPSTTVLSKNGSYSLNATNSSVGLTAPSSDLVLNSAGLSISTGTGGPYITSTSTDISLEKGTAQVYIANQYTLTGSVNYKLETNAEDEYVILTGGASDIEISSTGTYLSSPFIRIQGHNTTTAGQLRIAEQSSAGNNYVALTAPDLASNTTYVLPNAYPGSNGYVLASTTSGTLSWEAPSGGADGNGIYTGSGTIASAAIATVATSSTFNVNYQGSNTAITVNDSTGSVLMADKTFDSYMVVGDTGAGIYTASGNLVIDDSGGGAALNTNLRIYSGGLSLDSQITPAQITSNQNNYSPTGADNAAVIRLSSDATRTITGLVNTSDWPDGKLLTLINIGTFDIILSDENASSTAANRFTLGTDIVLGPQKSLMIWYDTTTDRWRPFSLPTFDGVTDHGALTGLADDDHSQYALLAGRASGQTLTGGTASGNALTLRSTTNATKGNVNLNDQGGNVIIGGGTTASELRLMEPSGSGTNYTAFVAAAQSTNQTYVLPTDTPANGEFLRWNTGGTLDWAAPTVDNTIVINAQTGTTYTLILTDANKLVSMNNAASNTLTIPTNASVAFPTGTSIIITQRGNGQTTIAPADGVTMRSADSKNKLRVIYSSATLVKLDTNEWLLTGDITS
jgi:hypothetical protein